MKPTERQKMCPNCDGQVAVEASQCPFCFATLKVDSATKGQSLQESLASYYNPPKTPSAEMETKPSTTKTSENTPAAAMEAHDTKAFWPILMLTVGGNLFTLGILQFFFSENGVVRLEISSSFWFLYLLIAIPLFYLGVRRANR